MLAVSMPSHHLRKPPARTAVNKLPVPGIRPSVPGFQSPVSGLQPEGLENLWQSCSALRTRCAGNLCPLPQQPHGFVFRFSFSLLPFPKISFGPDAIRFESFPTRFHTTLCCPKGIHLSPFLHPITFFRCFTFWSNASIRRWCMISAGKVYKVVSQDGVLEPLSSSASGSRQRRALQLYKFMYLKYEMPVLYST
jgi:hypothetical protein